MSKLTLDIYIISRCTHTYYARELKKLGISMGQFPFIVGINEQDGISQEKLSAEMKISKSTTAMIVQQLLTAGLITRDNDPLDRRNFRLHATAAGQALLPKIEAIIKECHQLLLQDLSEGEKTILIELLQKVRCRAELSLRK